jgi:salicylate hydroxylase
MHALIAGAGIGGLSAALACSHAGWSGHVLEQAAVFNEIGAGIQLGPNVVKRLDSWGLMPDLSRIAAFPEMLEVKSAISGKLLGRLRLGKESVQRYGFPYATVHRADLHGLLLKTVQQRDLIKLSLHQKVSSYFEQKGHIELLTQQGLRAQGDILIGADGLWSSIRGQMLDDGLPRPSGHLAYRTLVAQNHLPKKLRSQNVTVWLGAKLHLVHYPVHQDQSLNVVAIVHGNSDRDQQNWSHDASSQELMVYFHQSCSEIQALVACLPYWTRWAVFDRLPIKSSSELARGRVVLVGDAGHPMRPYLAQGAGMAIEDAHALGQTLCASLQSGNDVSQLISTQLALYASNRWQRNARVQARAIRNGEIFHLQGPAAWARNLTMRLFGERLLDIPWLYRG